MSISILADVTYHRGPLGWVVTVKLTTPAANTRTTQRRLAAAAYRVAAELETVLADGGAPDGDCLGYEISMRSSPLGDASVRLVLAEGDMPVDVSFAEELVIDACVACGLEPSEGGK